jgi:hypothetical protein
VRSIKAFEELLFDDLRLDIQNVRLLKKNKLKQYAQSYTQKNIKMLLKWFKKVTS